MVGGVLGELAAGDPSRALAIASLAALMVGVLAIAGWLLRLGRVVNSISETVLVGFKAGAALVIASTQLPKLLGLAGVGHGFLERLVHVGRHLGETDPLALAVGSGALVLLVAGERALPRRPVALVVVAIAVTSATDLGARGVHVVGAIPGGLPMPGLPGIRARDVDGLLLGVLRGVLAAAVVSMLALIRRAESPPTMVLGRLRGTDRFRSLAHHADAEVTPGVLVFRVDASLVYFNVEDVREALLRRVAEQTPAVRLVVFDLSSVPTVDLAGARMLAGLREELTSSDVVLELAQARRAVREAIGAAGLEESFGSLQRRHTVAEYVDRFVHGSTEGQAIPG